jgi:putative peptidoglycan lipid II flippase
VQATDDDAAGFARTSSDSTRAVLWVMFMAAAVLIAAAEPFARILAQHGPGATPDDVDSLARAIAAFAPGLVGYGLVAHLGRALYAHGRGRYAAAATVAGWVAVIVADLVFVAAASRDDAVPALALGNSVGMTVAGILLAVALTRTAPSALRGGWRVVAFALVAGGIASAAGRWLADALESSAVAANIGAVALVGVVGLVVFAAAISLVDRGALTVLRNRGASHV